MTHEQAKALVGKTVTLTGYGQCVILRVSKAGVRIEVWGGPCGDKRYQITVPASQLVA